MPPKKKEAEVPLDLPMTSTLPADVWNLDTSEPRASFIKRVSVDLLRIAAGEQKGYAKNDISSQAHARAVELADLLGIKD